MAMRKIALAAGTALLGVAALTGAQGYGHPAPKTPPATAKAAARPMMQAGTIQIYILAGQSNMVGYGLLPDLTAAEKTANPIIKVYGND